MSARNTVTGHEKELILSTEKEYVNITLKKDGIYLHLADAPEKGKLNYCFGYCIKRVVIPDRIIQAYQLNRKFFAEELSSGDYVIRGELTGKMPGVFDCQARESFPELKEKEILTRKTKKLTSGKISLGAEYKLGLFAKVEIYAGKKNYVRLTPVKENMEKLPTLQEVQEEYGRNLLAYPYDSICYFVDQSRNRTSAALGNIIALQLPIPFLRKWCENYDEAAIDCIRLLDGSTVLTPQIRSCAIDGSPIDPMKEPVHKVHVCEECAVDEGDKIAEMITLITGMTRMCEAIKESQSSLTSRVAELEKRF